MRARLFVLAGLCICLSGVAAAQVSVSSPLSSHVFDAGENRSYSVVVRHPSNSSPSMSFEGDIARLVSVSRGEGFSGETVFTVTVVAPVVNAEKEFRGEMVVSDGPDEERRPISVSVLSSNQSGMVVEAGFVSDEVAGNNFSVNVRGVSRRIQNTTVDVTLRLFESDTGDLVNEVNRSFHVNMSLNEVVTIPGGSNVSVGSYYVEMWASTGDRRFVDVDTVEKIEPFWTPQRSRVALFIIISFALGYGGWKGYQWYKRRKKEQARYVFPVDYNKLPNEGDDQYWVGEIAETSKQAYVDPSDLTTHAIVSGSTGSGKSVTASVVVEEALERDVPVVVFDPTAQWTGFVKECVDQDLLDHYERFGMDPDDDPHPYKGVIKKMDAEDVDVDFENMMNPGEVTVFTLNHLTTEEFDSVVREIIDSMFEIDWEESSELKLIVVFDEVHRLLEKYGGQGGYHALERGAREFRKWGIGLLMASQVTADFKQAVSGNIMSEFQLQTKSMEDINRVKKKYGQEFAKRITSQDVGVGMVQNPEYNDGNPWFVDFRPTFHNPHKIPESELEKYYDFTNRIDALREEIEEMKERDEDVYDQELELRLANDKLKEGRFRMAEMYISSLEDKLNMGESEDS